MEVGNSYSILVDSKNRYLAKKREVTYLQSLGFIVYLSSTSYNIPTSRVTIGVNCRSKGGLDLHSVMSRTSND